MLLQTLEGGSVEVAEEREKQLRSIVYKGSGCHTRLTHQGWLPRTLYIVFKSENSKNACIVDTMYNSTIESVLMSTVSSHFFQAVTNKTQCIPLFAIVASAESCLTVTS